MKRRAVLTLILAAALAAPPALSGALMVENFELQPETRWRFFTDRVMGGVSSGQVAFPQEDGRPHAHMTGTVSTANNGGFVQMRLDLPDAVPSDATGVRLVVRGNAERYFVHLRTTGTVLPWQYYQAGYDVTGDWREVRLPFDAFRRSGGLLRAQPRPGDIRSVAVVAYGRDHEVDIRVREIGFY
jgi:hypothetical protein